MKTQLRAAISSVLALAAYTGLAAAQDQSAAEESANVTELPMITVTGSLIPQMIDEATASPVVKITAEDIEAMGYRNVSDVLRAMPLSTGSVQDNQFTNGFTPNATTISLLSLDPGFTLFLIDGRPLADYPLLYNGQSNFTDLSSIPAAMVERLDILPGNQSAIYGSSAVAGVVNIILKKRLKGTQISARIGTYDQGGGDNMRFQLTGGQTWDKFDVTYGLQYSSQKAIWGYDRKRFDSTEDSPNEDARYGSRTFLVLDGFTGTYIDPGEATCDSLAGNFGGTTFYDLRPGRGNYCGSRAEPAYGTFLNEESDLAGYLNANFQVNDSTELYASVLVGHNESESNSGSRFWTPDVNGSFGYVWDDRDFSLNLYQHIFSPEETGGPNNYTTKSDSYNIALGVRGSFGASSWKYDGYYSRSEYRLKDSQRWPLTADIEDFFRDQFLGPQLGTYYGYPVYHPDMAAFYQSLTPDEYQSFLGTIKTDSRTWTQNVNLLVTNPGLFALPAGDVGVAALVQAGEQFWSNPTDPRVIDGDFWGITGTQGSGKRKNWAAAVEFRVPILESLSANVSGRYDDYENVNASSDSKFTYKVGLEFRPVDSLLIRGNYATAFRAPDMAYVFAGESGFFSSATDYYRCEVEGQPLDDCEYNPESYQGERSGNPDLKSITADSYGFGFVWSPTVWFDLRVDYYNVKIEDKVSDLSVDQLLQDENECRQGRLDINSPTCVDALSRIDRVDPDSQFQPNLLQLIRIAPINISQEEVSGIMAGTTFRWGSDRAGDFELALSYNYTLDHTSQQYPDDPVIDLLEDGFYSSEFRDILTADVTWRIGKVMTALHAVRYGPTPNYAEQLGLSSNNGVPAGDIDPYYLFNLNLDYQLTDNSNLALTVNNLLDEDPPTDKSWTGYPYFNIFNYNGYGRAYWLQYRIDLGKSN